MPVYHSSISDADARVLGSIPLLPIKTRVRGNAPPAAPNADDIIDEALDLYRANSFYRNFEIRGGSDRVLIYLILYIQECLLKLSKLPGQSEANTLLQTHAVQSFPVPGEAGFPLNAVYTKTSTNDETDQLRQYLTQMRQELSSRLVQRIYEDNKPSKWWMCFAKRKFMNIANVGTRV
ncbi:actin-related protein 2/3 complex subunit 3 [Polychytrium aggregatum]|uniref:actin-related protein 2/3 complex subunit 3 n=1 Tax=Polychytrium aggregatum TaxID=110093 RepID=UPI0022FE3736|nr:actin-related protein 2/3 complex subunit 3 [Polychytrium aggregatum]KAI9202934.1 actin-related protein 2/3 complex subunit 3 [Polychytrium aggregatum]